MNRLNEKVTNFVNIYCQSVSQLKGLSHKWMRTYTRHVEIWTNERASYNIIALKILPRDSISDCCWPASARGNNDQKGWEPGGVKYFNFFLFTGIKKQNWLFGLNKNTQWEMDFGVGVWRTCFRHGAEVDNNCTMRYDTECARIMYSKGWKWPSAWPQMNDGTSFTIRGTKGVGCLNVF